MPSDPVADLGDVGLALIDRYIRDEDLADLHRIVDRLSRAYAAEPEHPDRFLWLYWLGLAYAERARREPGRADLDRAVALLERLYHELPAEQSGHDEAADALLEAYWDRFWYLRYSSDEDVAIARAAVDQLIAGARRIELRDDDPLPRATLRMMLGLGHLERCRITDFTLDRDTGVELITAALREVPVGQPWRGLAAAELVHAYRMRGEAEQSVEILDQAVATGRAQLDEGGPDAAWWELTCEYLADAYGSRATVCGAVEDYDQAVVYARLRIDASDDDDGRLGLMAALVARAQTTAELHHLDAAVVELDRYLAESDNLAVIGIVWHELAKLHRTRWRATAIDADLDLAMNCADVAVTKAFDDEDQLLLAHNTRLTIAHDAITRDSDDQHDFDQAYASALRCRRAVQDGNAALNRAIHATPDQRALFAAVVGFAELWLLHLDGESPNVLRIRGLLGMAAAARGAEPAITFTLDVAEGLLEYWEDLQRPLSRGDRGVTKLSSAAQAGDPDVNPDVIWNVLSMALQARGAGVGDLRSRRMAVTNFRRNNADIELVANLLSGVEDLQRLDFPALLEHCLGALDLYLALPERSATRIQTGPMMNMLLSSATALTGHAFPQFDPSEVRTLPGQFGEHQRVMDMVPRLYTAIQKGDVDLIAELAADFETIKEGTPAGHAFRLAATLPAAMAHLEVAKRRQRSTDHAHRAVELFTEATALAQDVAHPLWTMIAMLLAESSRLTGVPGYERARSAGISALQGLAWQVALQSGGQFAAEVAREAAAKASILAAWCLADGAHDDLVSALDAGRGLVLSSATASRSIPAQLDAIGERGLADEWRETAGQGRDQTTGVVISGLAAAGEIGDNLRSRALRLLRHKSTALDQIGLSQPVRVGDIQESLSRVDADALVYLLPAANGQPGAAVIVPARGVVQILPLPRLISGPDSIARRYAAGRPGRKRIAGPVRDDRSVTLDAVCRWAWDVAMESFVVHLAARRPGRPARIVLVPMGDLGLVPWHAAYTVTPNGDRRYALADLIFSYTVSARMFQAAARQPLRRAESALIVGNPTGDLAGAGLEAQAIRRQFYDSGTYYGQPATIAAEEGTPDQILAWIAKAGSGPSLLHLACHAHANLREPADGFLLLAGERRLTAGALIDACAIAEIDIDQVFLAACTTGTAGDDYDEAFSLATVFLAAGADTVFGSLWPVGDADTSLLMFMLHHFIRAEGCDPMTALHRAQLWMIDPRRRPPGTMPADLVRLAGRDGVADPIAWAGFTHQGR